MLGPFVYINFIQGDPPGRLELSEAAASETSDASTDTRDLAGTWSVTDASQAGYRVEEVLVGRSTEAVGRTSDVTGDLVVSGTTIESASFDVDLTTVTSDDDRRDNQFAGRIMETATYPTATFELTEPITLEAVPGDLETVTVSATGEVTLRGVTNEVTFELTAQRNGDTIEVNGTIPIVFADYDIPDASFGPAVVEDNGVIEFLLIFEEA